MYRIIVLPFFLFMACSSHSHRQETNDAEHATHQPSTGSNKGLQLNNGAKWKTDDATKKNVGAMAEIVNDSNYLSARSASQLVSKLESQINELVKECSMSGPDHEALHTWLEQVMLDNRKISEAEPDEYQKLRLALKADVEQYFEFFE